MANWTATLISAVKDPNGTSSNIIVTVQFSNSVTLESQQRALPSGSFTVVSLKALCEQIIAGFNARDVALTLAANAIAAGGSSVILATG